MKKVFPKGLISGKQMADTLKKLHSQSVFVDAESADRIVISRVDSVLASVQSPYQQIDIFTTPHFGLVLALDGIIQLAQSDEHIYHELLIHPACLLSTELRSALIFGGGDGCAARELLRYKEIQEIEMVEIDQTVVDLCRIHLAPVNAGALDDPRVKIIVGEGESYLHRHPDKEYDLILADLTEPYDTAGPGGDLSRHLFSTEFYEFLKSHMSPEAILVVQTGGIIGNPAVDRHHASIIGDLRRSFRRVATCYVYIHSFDQMWTISLASDHDYDIVGLDPVPRLERHGISSLRYYDTLSHIMTFQTPRHIREELAHPIHRQVQR
ncbi:hypothetical protein ACFL2Q_10620 [Thermodesulfobacteriota bacterium]